MKIGVVGAGFVGLVTAACLANKKNIVTCIEINKKKIESLKSKKIPFYEPGLKEIFDKGKLQNVFSQILSDNLKEIGIENIPDSYKEIALKNILTEENYRGKIKYNDKILHQSKIMKFYLEDEEAKKIQKDIDKIFKKIGKNRKYFYSAKDLALVDALVKDGFNIPENFNRKELASKYEVPKNLLQLIEKKQSAFLTLKIVEIMGEDEPHQLDPETIYFITNLLNETDLIKIRNKILISALPQRV